MAKELPYFKFEPNQWENGNIQMLSREDKGLFIDLCSMYWSRLGDLPYKLAIQKLCGGNAFAFNSLCEEDIFEIIDGNIYIKFLSEQLLEFENTSKQNSKNAKDRWEKHRKQKEECDRNATVLNPQCENDTIREDKRKEDKIKKDKSFNFKNSLLSFVDDNDLVDDYIQMRKLRKASISKTVLNSLISECETNNYQLKDALKICIEKNWIGFKYSWVKNLEIQNKENQNGQITGKQQFKFSTAEAIKTITGNN